MPYFFLLALSLLSIAVYAVFLLLSNYFSANSLGNWIIMITLILICAGFLAVLYLMRLYDNQVMRILYLILSLAIGLIFYLTVSGMLFQIIKLASWPISPLALSRIGILVASVLFLIGLLEAGVPHVKNLSIDINNLPQYWQNKKIVQISDLHLGAIYGAGFLDRQIIKINSLDPDIIVITGDLFDGTDGKLEDFGPALAKLKAKEAVIFVPGNHDTYLGLDKVEKVLENTGIRTLRDEAVNIRGLEIIGLDFKQSAGDQERIIKGLDNSSSVRLLLNHVPTGIDLAKKMNVSLQLSGHSHRGQMFPLSLMTRAIFGKYQYGLHSEGNFNIYTSSGLGSWGPPVRTFNRAEIVAITLK